MNQAQSSPPKARLFIASGCIIGTLLLIAMLLIASWQLYQRLYEAAPVLSNEATATTLAPPTRKPATVVPTATLNGEAASAENSELDTSPTQTPKPTPDLSNTLGGGSGKIAFTSNETGNFDIFVSDIDGSSKQQLTDSWFGDWHPVWSPDGEQLLFHSKRDGNWELYLMDADGENKINLTNNRADDSFAHWHPDGDKIVFHSNRDGDYDIYMMDADGENVTNLTGTRANEYGPHPSPDGKQIAFSRQLDYRQVFVMDIDGENEQQLTDANGGSYFPYWHPDSDRLVFHSDRENGKSEIFQIDSDGENLERVTNNENEIEAYFPTFSPDGEWITYHANVGNSDDGNRNIILISANRLQEKSLTTLSSQERMPHWQP